MKVDITALLVIFNELMAPTNEEQGIYWFKSQRPDGFSIKLSFSTYESYVDIIIHTDSKVDVVGLSLKNCSEIRVLDENRKCLEILHANGSGRCFLSLLGTPILDYSE